MHTPWKFLRADEFSKKLLGDAWPRFRGQGMDKPKLQGPRLLRVHLSLYAYKENSEAKGEMRWFLNVVGVCK